VEAFPDRCVLRALNTSLSAFAAVTLPAAFFSGYEVFNEGAVRAALPAKHVLASLRGGRADSVALVLAPAHAEAVVTVTTDAGLTKRFRLAALDAVIMTAAVDGAALPAGFAAAPGELGTLLASLGGGAHATLRVGPPPPPGAPGHAVVELSSYAGGGGGGGGAHRPAGRGVGGAAPSTRLQLGAASSTLRAVRAPPTGARVTLSSRDLRALLPLCDAVGADVDVRFGAPGGPALACPLPRDGGPVGTGDGTAPDVQLVLATQVEEEEEGGGAGRVEAPAASVPPPSARPAGRRDPYAFGGTPAAPAQPASAVPPSAAGDSDDSAVAGGDGVDDEDDDDEGVQATPQELMPRE
jgi:hypothetical protein